MTENNERFNFRLSSELLEELEKRCELLDKSKSEHLRELIKDDINEKDRRELETRIQQLKEQKKHFERKAKEFEQKIQQKQSKLEEFTIEEEEYWEDVQELANDAKVAENPETILDETSPRVRRIGREAGKSSTQVVHDALDQLGIDSFEEIENVDHKDQRLQEAAKEGGDE